MEIAPHTQFAILILANQILSVLVLGRRSVYGNAIFHFWHRGLHRTTTYAKKKIVFHGQAISPRMTDVTTITSLRDVVHRLQHPTREGGGRGGGVDASAHTRAPACLRPWTTGRHAAVCYQIITISGTVCWLPLSQRH